MSKSRQLSDEQILRRSRMKVLGVIIGYYLLTALGFIGGYFLLSVDFLPHPPALERTYLLSMLVQWFVMLGIFALFMTEKPWSRTVYWVFFGLEFLTFGLPVWVFFQERTGLVVCLLWMALIAGKLFVLCSLGRWLNHSRSAKVYFEKVLLVSSPEEAEPVPRQQPAQARQSVPARQPRQTASAPRPAAAAYPGSVRPASQTASVRSQPVQNRPVTGQPVQNRPVQNGAVPAQARGNASGYASSPRASVRRPDYHGGIDHPGLLEDKSAKAYPKLALRLGAVVYGSLIFFPILVQIFQDMFVSTDNQQVFATRLVFTICIITAVLWTIPIFFLYLKEPFSKSCCWICLGLEVIAAVWFGFQLYGYNHSETVQYGWQVFLYLIVLDVVRLALLAWAVWPVFTLPAPRQDEDELEARLEEELPDELIEADDSEFFEEVPEGEESSHPGEFLGNAASTLRSRLSDLSTRILLDDPGSPDTQPQKPDTSAASGKKDDESHQN